MNVRAYIVIVIAILSAIFFFRMWRRGVRDSVHLTNMIALILLNDETCQVQRSLLIEFIRGAKYRDAATLAGMVSAGLSGIAARLAPQTMTTVNQTMWGMNQEAAGDTKEAG